ncbi:MAG TPA: amino acid adenylation domain-containing protein [Pilimelia sp.]|nr:amino acid adenylation domain-containing protein [Pilimelia sp.]
MPLLAIRHMVPTDFPFLRDDPEHVAGSLARYADQVPSHLRDEVRAAVARFGLATGDGPDEPGTPVALTAAQQRLWFLNQLDPGNPVQHVATCLRLRGRLGRQAVARGVQALVARHPLLRLTLAERDGEPVAVVAAAADARVPLIDLTGVAPADREAAAERRVRGEVRRPFDLRRGPLLRGTLVRLGDDDHRLVLTAHRLAADARSLDELCLELGELYGATASRVAADAAMPWVAAGAADAAVSAVAADVPAQVEYWIRRLAGAPTALTLPTDRPRPAAQSYRGAVHRFSLPASLVRDVRSLTGGPLLPALLATFGAVLARHSGQPEVLVGTGVDTRGRRSDVVGPYTNTVVVRATASDGVAFRELLGRVRADLAAATAHGQAPFEHVVEALRVPRSMDRSPLFQAQVTVRESAPQLPVLPDLAVSRMPVDTGAVAVDLALTAEPATGGEHAAPGDLHLALEYSTDLFDASTAGRLAGHLATLLHAAAADPDRPVDELPLLTPAERATLLVDWQGPAVALPEPASAGALLDRWADSDATAVVGPDGRLTYREMHRRANQLAHVLRAWGAGPDVPVGLCVERSAAMVVAMLGVWRAGAAYVPLDPAFPAERLRLMLADSAATVVVTNRPARERAAQVLAEAAGLICLDEDADVLAAQPEQPPAVTPGGDDLAYVIYTSGSTGRPKGVEVPHRAVANLLVSFGEALGLAPDDRWLAVTTLSFDIALLELVLPLTRGARVVVAGAAEVADAEALRARAVASGASVMQATPTTWRLLLAAGGVPETIRHRLCGGEAVPRDLADALHPAAGGPRAGAVWNVYGPTETTVWSAAGRVAPSPAPIVLGPPIANTGLYVLDRHGQPVPAGVTGELHIGGAGLARGYRNRAELTAQRFAPARFPEAGGARLYATGDLARWRADGRLDFLGRADDQVKVRGFRVELGDVEAALRRHEDIADAAAGVWTGEDGDARLVAYAVPRTPGMDPWPDVQRRLREILPDYLVPATLVLLDALPLTPNGKVDRRALPAPTWQARAGAHPAGRVPSDPVERAVAAIWQEVLGVAEVGADDDFFDLGGHSLLGARLLARLRAYFHTDVPIRSLFEAPTVAGMARVLERLEPAPGQIRAIVALREEIDAMSPDDVEVLLDREPQRESPFVRDCETPLRFVPRAHGLTRRSP